MKAPRSLKITDEKIGTGRKVVPGDIAVCHYSCRRSKGCIVLDSTKDGPYSIQVGGRDSYAGLEYGLLGMQIGGRRKIVVPPNLTYDERKTFTDIPDNAILIYSVSLIDLREKWDPEMESRLRNSASEKDDFG